MTTIETFIFTVVFTAIGVLFGYAVLLAFGWIIKRYVLKPLVHRRRAYKALQIERKSIRMAYAYNLVTSVIYAD